MKKTVLAMLMAGSSCAVFAQNDTTNRMMMGDSNKRMTGDSMTYHSNDLSSNGNYNAFGSYTATAPDYMQSYITRDYPTATDIRWQQNGDWWHGYYYNNNEPMHLYYNSAGQTFTASLPVRQTLVPEMVVSKATEMYGPTLYDVTAIKGTNGENIYAVRTIENGMLNTQWIGEDGSKVIDVYRQEGTMNADGSWNGNTNGNMNSGNMNSNYQNGNMNGTNGTMNGNMNSGRYNADSMNRNGGMRPDSSRSNMNNGSNWNGNGNMNSNGSLNTNGTMNNSGTLNNNNGSMNNTTTPSSATNGNNSTPSTQNGTTPNRVNGTQQTQPTTSSQQPLKKQ